MLGEIVRVVAGLAVTLGLIGLAVVVLRRFGPETLRSACNPAAPSGG